MTKGGHILQDHSNTQRSDDLNRLMEILISGNGNKVGLIPSRVRHQPNAHLNHNA